MSLICVAKHIASSDVVLPVVPVYPRMLESLSTESSSTCAVIRSYCMLAAKRAVVTVGASHLVLAGSFMRQVLPGCSAKSIVDHGAVAWSSSGNRLSGIKRGGIAYVQGAPFGAVPSTRFTTAYRRPQTRGRWRSITTMEAITYLCVLRPSDVVWAMLTSGLK